MTQEITKPQEKKLMKVYLSGGNLNGILFESVTNKDRPMFLVYEKNEFKLFPHIKDEEIERRPLPKTRYSHRPIEVSDKTLEYLNNEFQKVDRQHLFNWNYEFIDTFIDMDKEYKLVSTAFILLTYQQQKTEIQSTPYPFFHGLDDCGKTQALRVINNLCFRPLFGEDIKKANIYRFLEQGEGCGTILEDEAEDLERQKDKMRIYRAGYKKDSYVPITDEKTGLQKLYPAFCCKSFASIVPPWRDKAFIRRCILIPMISGYPKKDEIEEEDKKLMDVVRTLNLAFKMKTFFEPTHKILDFEKNLGFRGRVKEIYKPMLQIIDGLNIQKEMEESTMKEVNRRIEERCSSRESYVAKAVLKAVKVLNKYEIPFIVIWGYVIAVYADSAEIKVDKKGRTYLVTDNHGDMFKASVSKIIRSYFGAQPIQRVGTRNWIFSKDKLERIKQHFLITDDALERIKLEDAIPQQKTLTEPVEFDELHEEGEK